MRQEVLMKNQPRNERGFTLIELLIVVVIIGVLAAIAIPKFSSVRERSYMTMVIQDLKNLASQQEIYHGDNFTYSGNTTALNMVESAGVHISVNQFDGRGWAATATHAALPTRQCGIFYGEASAANGAPATEAGLITCTP
jgi:prepilin-type N-terminal cleavage/methylation domain-containing protein